MIHWLKKGFAWFCALAIRIIRPLICIRFGALYCSRIGHFVANTETYLSECDCGLHGRRVLDFFFFPNEPVCNDHLKKMWQRRLRVCSFAGDIDSRSRRLPGWEAHVVPFRNHQARDIHGVLSRTSPHLSFTDEEEEEGRRQLVKIGLSSDSPFVCFHVRDDAYLEKWHRQWMPDYDSHYHDYRDASVSNYLPAMEEVAKRGYAAFRMGSAVKNPIAESIPGVVEYATLFRTDFMDVYLPAKCRFFVATTAGLYAVAQAFRKPIVWTNFVPLEHVHAWASDDLIIPKKLWLKAERRWLTFREIIGLGLARADRTEEYDHKGVDVVENTAEEIKAVVMEMDDRLRGLWRTTDDDEELQRRFWSLFKPNDLNQIFKARIGAEFLRENRGLLD